jgi:signal transduction histidine kinase
LLDNARKFTDPSEAHYHDNHDGEQKKATLRVYTDAEYLRFCIEDNGIGVPSDEAERIFNEFVQLDEYYNGTGIGLTVARSQARRLGGDIWLDPTYSGGARFIYILPLAKEDTDTEVETI